MLDIINKDDYRADSVHKNLVIELDDGTTIDNMNIKSESMKLNEILMDSTQLQFGRCNSSQFSVTLADIASNIKGKTIKPYIVVGGNEINKSAEGNPITVTDSGNYPFIEFKEDGYTQQNTLSGKNKFNKSDITSGYYLTADGVENVGESWNISNYIEVVGGSAITLSGGTAKGVNTAVCWYDSSKNYIGGEKYSNRETVTITLPSNALYIRASVEKTVLDTFQIEEGSTATDYEPYCGGIPSPNPNYPQDIQGLGDDGNIEVLTTGKNLFGGIALANALKNSGSTNVVVDEENGTVEYGHSRVGAYTIFNKFKQNTQYTIILNGTFVNGNSTNLRIWYTDGSDAWITILNKPFVTPLNKTVNHIEYSYATEAITTLNYNQCGVFEGVITESEFEPYQSSSATIPIDAPLYEGDYIEYFADGTGQIVRKYERVVYDGSSDEVWSMSNLGFYTVVPNAKLNIKAYCDNYVYNETTWSIGNFGIASSGNLWIADMTNGTTGAEWRAWLQSNPITVVYELAEPTVTPLTAEQVNEFKKLMTFEGATRITNNDNANMTVKYKYNKALPLGVFTVKEVPRLSQTPYKQITALDNMHKIDKDVTEWYSNLTFPMTQKEFRDSFFEYIGLEQVETTLLFDDLVLDNPFGDVGQINGRTIAEGLCELNATFGHCDREGRFNYVSLKYDGLYPAEDLYPADDVYPGMLKYPSDNNEIIEDLNNLYIKASYDEFETQFIERILVIDDYGSQLANSDDTTANTYVINNNYLLYGREKAELLDIMNRFQSVVRTQTYRPASIDCKGLPYVELGDRVRVSVKDDEILTYVFNRTLTGIQALRDTYSADGEEYLINDLNSIQVKMDSLNRKTDRLKIEVTATAKGLESKVSKGEFQTYQQQTAESISSKVSKGSVVSEINQSAEEVKIQADKIALEGTVTANGNTKINEDGTIEAKNGSFTGTVTSTDANIKGDLTSNGSIKLYQSDINLTTELKTEKSVFEYTDYNWVENGGMTGSSSEMPDVPLFAIKNANGVKVGNYLSAEDVKADMLFAEKLQGKNLYGLNGYFGGIKTQSLSCIGTKSREITTPNYGNRLEYCYEMPTPYFGDIGEGITDDEGICYIFLDDIFAETIDTNCEYQVFLQAYDEGTVYVNRRNSSYFVVKGTPNMRFAWEIKAVQRDYEMYRLEEPTEQAEETTDYAEESYDYLASLLYDVEQESEVIINE